MGQARCWEGPFLGSPRCPMATSLTRSTVPTLTLAGPDPAALLGPEMRSAIAGPRARVSGGTTDGGAGVGDGSQGGCDAPGSTTDGGLHVVWWMCTWAPNGLLGGIYCFLSWFHYINVQIVFAK